MLCWLQFYAVLCLVTMAQCQPNTTEAFTHSAVLDAGDVMTLYWNFNDTSITFEIHGKTEGWVGIGFSPSGSMANADIIVGWVKNGVATLTDRHGGQSNGYPPQDTVRDVALLEGMEVDGYTVIKFRRLLATCDSEDVDITTDTIKMIYAWGVDDPTGDDLTFSDQHAATNKGVKSMLLLNPAGRDEVMFPEGETHLTFDLLNDNFHVPAVEPIIQAGHELNVHHILVYHCTDDANITLINEDAKCYTSNMPEDFHSCSFPVVAWAIGGAAFHYPKHAGYPLGSPGAPKYVVLETHYDNPEIKADIVDSSGLRFYYTPDLRTYDAGILEVGHIVSGFSHIIPPNAESFLDYGECSSNCLDTHFKREGKDSLNVFAVMLHSHLLGHALTLRHVRNGTELPYLAKDSSYDFNFQETRFLPEERVVKMGDSLQMVCNSNSLGRTDVTVGGLSTSEEMCVSYVYYYPRIALAFCETQPAMFDLLPYFGIGLVSLPEGVDMPTLGDLVILTPPEYANLTVLEVLNSINWDEQSADDFSLAVKSMARRQNCYSTGEYPSEIVPVWPPPKIDHPYVEPTNNCSDLTPDTTTDSSSNSFTTTPIHDTITTHLPDNTTTMKTTTPITPIQEEETTSSATKLTSMFSFVTVFVLIVFQTFNGF